MMRFLALVCAADCCRVKGSNEQRAATPAQLPANSVLLHSSVELGIHDVPTTEQLPMTPWLDLSLEEEFCQELHATALLKTKSQYSLPEMLTAPLERSTYAAWQTARPHVPNEVAAQNLSWSHQ